MISFRGKYWFLSNFYPAELEYNGLKYKTAEHAYQAEKAVNLKDVPWIMNARTPGEAKRRGGRIVLRVGWDDVKLGTMLEIVRAKFRVRVLAEKLLATGDDELVEYNTWGDTFWGMCNGRGENHLGKILMKVRQEIRNDYS